MEPTANPEDGRQSRDLARFWPAEGTPTPERDASVNGHARPSTTEPSLSDTESGPGADGPPLTKPGPRPSGISNGPRWNDQGGFHPVETNGHRNGQTGPRHGGRAQANGTPLTNGQSPVINGSLPMSRSPFAPPPETPPLYAPSPFAAASNPLLPDPPPDPFASARPDSPADEPDGHAPARLPVSGPPATGSASVPPPSSNPADTAGTRPASESRRGAADTGPDAPAPDPDRHESRHDAWALPSHHESPLGAADGIAASLDPFPDAFTPQQKSADGPERWIRPEASAGTSQFRTDPLPPSPVRPESVRPEPVRGEQPEGGRRARDEAARDTTRYGITPDAPRAKTEPETRTAGRDESAGARPASRRAAGEVPAGRRAADDAGPLRPGDLHHSPIAFWDETASERFRGEWHEVKAQFVDDPVTALTRAHDLLTEAVRELTESMLTQRDELDPLRDAAITDTESMRMAMRGYREFLDRILAL
ncbi:hypothetical protein AB0M36_22000 [Actinoplanes sp. NPDC051346]|uniref:hypothetical protein n=1 Tax=Actinoplanes sp. NPDC051346 TaxID=3155048 RepID=UPI0034385D4B